MHFILSPSLPYHLLVLPNRPRPRSLPRLDVEPPPPGSTQPARCLPCPGLGCPSPCWQPSTGRVGPGEGTSAESRWSWWRRAVARRQKQWKVGVSSFWRIDLTSGQLWREKFRKSTIKENVWYDPICQGQICSFSLFLFLLRATHVAYGSWARGSNPSYRCWPTPQPQKHQIRALSTTHTTAYGNAGPLTHWVSPGIKWHPHGHYVRFLTHWATKGTPIFFLLKNPLVLIAPKQFPLLPPSAWW